MNPDLATRTDRTTLTAAYARIGIRLLPVLMVLYLIAFLDRINTSIAALTMNPDLGITDKVFSLGSGIFFIGYFLFEVPSNFMLARVGARLWISVIMVFWGGISVMLGFVQSPVAYVVLRFLLGAAEAGFFPGIVLYLTYWLPASVRGRYMGLFVIAIPLSTVIGAPLSVAILGLNGTAGLRGWQWLFLLEGLLAVGTGALVPALLPNRPGEAHWLPASEAASLENAIRCESPPTKSAAPTQKTWVSLLRSRAVLTLTVAYFTLMIGLYGLTFWVPRMLTADGIPLARVGLIAAVPFVISAAGTVLWSRYADRMHSRPRHLVLAFACAGAGMALPAGTHSAAIAVLGFSVASLGIFTAMSLFWAQATLALGSGAAVVGGIALINALGNFGGFVGPVWMGFLLERTRSFTAGLLAIAATLAVGALLIRSTNAKPCPINSPGTPATSS